MPERLTEDGHTSAPSEGDGSGSEKWRDVALGLGIWTLVLAASTLVLWRFRGTLDEAHKTLAYLLLVLGASARNGRTVGLALAVISFFAFNYLLLPPYYTLSLEDPIDWWVLVGFLLTAAVAAQLFHNTHEARAAAERRAREAERFTALAAESLAAPTAAAAVLTVARVMRAELPVRSVQVLALAETKDEYTVIARTPEDDTEQLDAELVRFAVREERLVALETNGTTHVAPAGADLASLLVGTRTHVAVMIPLRIQGRPIGVIRIGDPEGLSLDRAQTAFAEGLAGYAALAVERARLAREAERVAALAEADRLKDALIASISHDLRTPLTTIRALAAEMRGGQDERAAIIESEADRLNRLVTDILDLSRIRANALPLDLQIVAGEDLAGAALQRLSGVEGSERILVRLPADGSLPAGRIDFVQSLRALSNLLENALRHSPADHPVELEIGVEDESLTLRVLDRGPGIPEAERERVFEPFYRATSPAGAQGSGTGLGLAIARSVAAAQGGSVEYLPRPGGGSTFVLKLPAEPVLLD